MSIIDQLAVDLAVRIQICAGIPRGSYLEPHPLEMSFL